MCHPLSLNVVDWDRKWRESVLRTTIHGGDFVAVVEDLSVLGLERGAAHHATWHRGLEIRISEELEDGFLVGSPQALHMGFPSWSRRQRGVESVPQFAQKGPPVAARKCLSLPESLWAVRVGDEEDIAVSEKRGEKKDLDLTNHSSLIRGYRYPLLPVTLINLSIS
jgi:hypothetical protein